MVEMMRQDTTLDHLQSTFSNVALMLNIQCLVLLNKMRLRRGGITCFLIRCNVCLLINSSLRKFLWGEALKTAAYTLPKCLVSLFLRLHMSYGHRRSLVFVTSMFGATRWK